MDSFSLTSISAHWANKYIYLECMVTHRTIFCIQNRLYTIIGMYFKLNCHANQLPSAFIFSLLTKRIQQQAEKYTELVGNLQSVYIIKIISNSYFTAKFHAWNRMAIGNKRSWWLAIITEFKYLRTTFNFDWHSFSYLHGHREQSRECKNAELLIKVRV